jgi:hypothetical protein
VLVVAAPLAYPGKSPAPSPGASLATTERLDIVHHFAAVQDPRDGRYTTHLLEDLLTIGLCAVLSGARGFQGIAEFALP